MPELDEHGERSEAEPAPASTRPSGSVRPVDLLAAGGGCTARRIAAEGAVVGAIAGAITFLVFGLWHRSLRRPFDYEGDGLFYAQIVKTILETGWVGENERMGAPFGQRHEDLPLGADNLHLLVIKGLTWLSDDWVLVLNAFFLLGFPAAAIAAHVAGRHLGARTVPAAVAATLFAFLPYHYFRGPNHLFLASYAMLPFAVLLAARAASGTMPWAPSAAVATGRRAADLLRALPWLLAAIALASCGAYYFFFGALLIGAGGIVASVSSRTWRPLLAAGATLAIAAVTFAVNILPSITYWMRNGRNPEVAHRSVLEADQHALRLVEMVSPLPRHVVGPLEELSSRLYPVIRSEGGQFLGIVGAVALLAMLGGIVMACVRGRPRDAGDSRPFLMMLTVVVILFGVSGGLSWLGNLVGFSQIRAPGRLSIVIGFLVLTWAAIAAGRLLERRPLTTPRARGLALAVTVLAASLAVLDQRPHPLLPRAVPEALPAFEIDRDYFAAIERTLPEESMVYQLPYQRYPEEPQQHLSRDYDLARPFLHTDTLRWSYGGMKGRTADWQQQLDTDPMGGFLDDLVIAGYTGLLVDRAGYTDGGNGVFAETTKLVTTTPLFDTGSRWGFFDLRTYATEVERRIPATARAARRRQLLQAPHFSPTSCYPRERVLGSFVHWCDADGQWTITAPLRPTTVRLSGMLYSDTPGTVEVTVHGQTHRFPVDNTDRPFELTIEVTGEHTRIGFSSDVARVVAPIDPRELHFRLVDVKVEEILPVPAS